MTEHTEAAVAAGVTPQRVPALHSWIAGTPEASEGPERIHPVDPNSGAPSTGEPLPAARETSEAQLERAFIAADAAHADGRWFGLPLDERCGILESFAAGLDARGAEIARLDALDSGVPIGVTALFGAGNGGTVRDAIGHARVAAAAAPLAADHAEVRVHRVPWGPAALITPWNAPSAMVVKKMAYALAAGAPVVVKPSSAAPHSAELIAEAAAEAGFPAGTWSLVRGGAVLGRAMSEDPRIAAISMTGSTPVGRDIAVRSAPRFTRLQLELGANSPAIVRADADIDATAEALISGAWKLSGQWCEAPRRVYADASVHSALLDALVTESLRWRVGSSLDPDTQLGPVAFPERREELLAQRAELVAAGARVVNEAPVPSVGCFVPPSILDGNGAEPEGEVFGPILVVHAVKSDEAALAAASRGHVGLAAYVFTADEAAGRALGVRLPAGEVKLNSTSVLDMAPGSEQSFFGASGLGGHGDARLLEFFTGARVVGVDRPGLPL